MTIVLDPTIRQTRLQDVADAIAGGSLVLYAGTRPAYGVTTGLSQQAQVTLANPCATVSVPPTIALTFTTVLEALRTGNLAITWCRFYKADATCAMDMDVTTTADGTGDLLLDTVDGVIGSFIQITGGSITG